MNRASLLHILDHATGISEAEVRELEQLATAFPYCQTAHLLLAKAAHDRGSMLAGQRLRRAATYAADRELLRQLIEQTALTSASASAPAEPPTPANEAVMVPAAERESVSEPLPRPTAPAFESAPVADLHPDAAVAQPVAAATEPEPLVAEENQQSSPEESPTERPVSAAPAAEEPSMAEPAAALAEAAEAVTTAPAAEAAPLAEPELAAAAAPDGAAETADESPVIDTPELQPVSEADAASAEVVVSAASGAVPVLPVPTPETPLVNDELPPAAPPIRPPVEAGSSRFEFGLGETPEPGPLYQLPELPEESTATATPPFRADELLAYALAAGSRFGAALTLRDAELTQDLPGTPTWHPDAVLLAHAAAHRPAPPAAPSSLALIDKFLRSQPRIKSAARPAPTDAPQADLSVRSTSAAPSLASESLAKIMVKQGKTARAIEIYEQLMQRQPEKKAYFAAQIDLLNQQTE